MPFSNLTLLRDDYGASLCQLLLYNFLAQNQTRYLGNSRMFYWKLWNKLIRVDEVFRNVLVGRFIFLSPERMFHYVFRRDCLPLDKAWLLELIPEKIMFYFYFSGGHNKVTNVFYELKLANKYTVHKVYNNERNVFISKLLITSNCQWLFNTICCQRLEPIASFCKKTCQEVHERFKIRVNSYLHGFVIFFLAE